MNFIAESTQPMDKFIYQSKFRKVGEGKEKNDGVYQP